MGFCRCYPGYLSRCTQLVHDSHPPVLMIGSGAILRSEPSTLFVPAFEDLLTFRQQVLKKASKYPISVVLSGNHIHPLTFFFLPFLVRLLTACTRIRGPRPPTPPLPPPRAANRDCDDTGRQGAVGAAEPRPDD